MPATGGTSMSGYGASNWGQTRGVGAPRLWCQQQERVRVLAPATGTGAAPVPTGRTGTVCVLGAATGETGASEVSEALSAASGLGPQVTAPGWAPAAGQEESLDWSRRHWR